MDRTALRLGIDELNAAYADCIDDDRLEEWPDFFVEQGRYLITDRESHRAGLRHGVIYCASRDMAIDRVMATRRVLVYEPHRYRHLVGPAAHRPRRGRGRRGARQFPRRAHHAQRRQPPVRDRALSRPHRHFRAGIQVPRTHRRARQPEDRHAAGDSSVTGRL